MRANTTLHAMREGRPAIGAGVILGSPLVAEEMARQGFDFVLVDMQHGLWSDAQAMDAIHYICATSATPMVRVQQNDYYTIGRMLDRGAIGIIVPMVNSVAEARAAASAVRYPPRGARSMGPTGTGVLGEDYVRRIDGEVFVALQIETWPAAQVAADILDTEGVDAVWIGPGDLALSMGVDLTTERGRRAHEAAILHIRDACLRSDKIPGIAATAESTPKWVEEGFLFITSLTDVELIARGGPVLAGVREAVGARASSAGFPSDALP